MSSSIEPSVIPSSPNTRNSIAVAMATAAAIRVRTAALAKEGSLEGVQDVPGGGCGQPQSGPNRPTLAIRAPKLSRGAI